MLLLMVSSGVGFFADTCADCVSSKEIGSATFRNYAPISIVLPFTAIIGATLIADLGFLSMRSAVAFSTAAISASLMFTAIGLAKRLNEMAFQLRSAAVKDSLTGLYNLRGFNLLGEHTYADTQRYGGEFHVLYFDLDGLKEVNDTRGHDAGSELLLQFASLLRLTFRSSDILGRVGGDEFVVVTAKGDARIAIDRLRKAAKSAAIPFLSYSVGIAQASFDVDESFSLLVARADERMLKKKSQKHGTRSGKQARPVKIRDTEDFDPAISA